MLFVLPLLLFTITLRVYVVHVYNSLILFIRHNPHRRLEFTAGVFFTESVFTSCIYQDCAHISAPTSRGFICLQFPPSSYNCCIPGSFCSFLIRLKTLNMWPVLWNGTQCHTISGWCGVCLISRLIVSCNWNLVLFWRPLSFSFSFLSPWLPLCFPCPHMWLPSTPQTHDTSTYVLQRMAYSPPGQFMGMHKTHPHPLFACVTFPLPLTMGIGVASTA